MATVAVVVVIAPVPAPTVLYSEVTAEKKAGQRLIAMRAWRQLTLAKLADGCYDGRCSVRLPHPIGQNRQWPVTDKANH